jgi:hypothetical protein
MFKALEGEAYTIKINSGASAAQYTILSQQRVVPLLNSLMKPPASGGADKVVTAEKATAAAATVQIQEQHGGS